MSEADFITRQHLDSLTPASDPSMAEVMNKYKFPPASPPARPPHNPMGGYAGYPAFFSGAPNSTNNDMLLGSILGQLQANQSKQSDLDGLSININAKVLMWIIIVILLAILIWLALRVQQKKKNPLKKRLRKLEKEFKRMRRFKKKNPKALSDDSLDSIEDTLFDLEEDI